MALIFVYACVITLVGGLPPFLAMIALTNWLKSRRAGAYALICGGGCLIEFLAIVASAASGGNFFAFMARSPSLGALWFGLCGAVGGLAYWFFARGRPPISTWSVD